jgi:FkbM family methyltransferase
MNSMQIAILTMLLGTVCVAVPNPAQSGFFKGLIKPGALVFDVGANNGQKSVLFNACGARIVCIEPQPDCCNKLRSLFKNNKDIVIEQIGLAEKPGSLTLSICSDSNAISTFSKEWQTNSRFSRGYTWDKTINVEITTLDNLIAKYGLPDYCKIDVENFEYEVVAGLSQPIPLISLEFAMETFHNTEKCLAHLKKLGYKEFNFIVEENASFFLNKWISADELIAEIKKQTVSHALKSLLWGDIFARIII